MSHERSSGLVEPSGLQLRSRAAKLRILRLSTVGRRHREIAEIARSADAVGYDALLINDDGDLGADPLATACALAPVTKRIGLIPAVDTSRIHPFGLARKMVGFDQASHGRAGWAPFDSAPHRLREAVTIANRLWVSWPQDAIVADKEAGVWADVDRVRSVDFDGDHYSTHAPLDMPRSVQGQPLLLLSADLARIVDAPALTLEDQIVVDYDGEVHGAQAAKRDGATLRERAGILELAT